MKHSLFSYEPDTYKKSQVMREILNAQEAQLLKEEERQSGIVADMYPSQTIHPERWEGEYNIPPADTLEERRKNIVSKIRGTGTSTLQMVKDIVEAYTDGIVTPIEKNDDSLIDIQIVSNSSNISDADLMEEQLNNTLPAHIGFQLLFRRAIIGHTYSGGAVVSGALQSIETKNKTVTIGTAAYCAAIVAIAKKERS